MTPPPHHEKPAFRFRGHTFHPRTGEIVRADGVTHRLQPQPAAVLAMLLERAPGLVTREELRERVWPDTLVEFDQGINFCVRQIREALDETASDPRFVETLPRRGYRFIAEVQKVGSDPGATGREAEGPNVPLRRWRVPLVGIGVVVLGAILFGRPGGEGSDVDPTPMAPAGEEAVPTSTLRIAVLPFRHGGGGDPTGAGLALAEALTADLAMHPGLGVVGPASTRRFTGDRAATDVVGSELDVHYVLSGTIEPRPDSTMFFLQLVRVSDLEHLWAERMVLPGPPGSGIPTATRRATARVRGLILPADGAAAPSERGAQTAPRSSSQATTSAASPARAWRSREMPWGPGQRTASG